MALKDWELIDDFEDNSLWQNKKTKQDISAWDGEDGWIFTIEIGQDKFNHKTFKTKQLAQAYARQYMRTH